MGISDRDYYRKSPPRFAAWMGDTPACTALLTANLVVFLLQLLTVRTTPNITALLSVDLPSLAQGELWRLVTYAFCHDPHFRDLPWHLIFNMLVLWYFGPAMEGRYGTREFVRFYFAGVLAAAGLHVGLSLLTHDGGRMIGASGAVLAVLVLYACYHPRQQMLFMFVIPIEMRWLVALYLLFDLTPVLRMLAGSGDPDGVAHAAHVGGLLYGLAYYWFDLRFTRLGDEWRNWRRRVKRPAVKLYREPERPRPERRETPREVAPPPPVHAAEPRVTRMEEREHGNALPPAAAPGAVSKLDLETRLDEILAKIAERGEGSLTDDDRRLLLEASERYRRKRR